MHNLLKSHRFDGNFFLKRANELFFISGHSNKRVDDMDYMGITMSPKIPWCYLMAMEYEEAKVHRSAIMQDFG